MSNQTQLLAICCQMGLPRSGAESPEPVPALIVGSPGTAKTATLAAIGTALEEKLGIKFPVETLACPQASAENIAGIPVPNHTNKTTDMYVLALGRILIEAQAGILFLDEFSSASDGVAAASLTLVQSGLLGDHKLPSSVARIVAMNHPDKATNGRDLMAPESNRFCWIDWKLETTDWISYMKGGAGIVHDLPILPANWEAEYYFQAQSLVTAFITARPNKLLEEPNPEDAGKAWPSPRSWRNATRLLAACMSLGKQYDDSLTLAAVEGCVGPGPAIEFLAFVKSLDLPDPEEVLKQGVDFSFKGVRDDRTLAILEAVAGVACKKDHVEYAKRWWTACDIINGPAAKKLDVALEALKYLMRNMPKGLKIHPVAAKYHKMMKDLGLLHSQTV